jgi:hypothetical protein
MDRLLTWIGQLIGTAVAGPGATVLGDPGLSAEEDMPRGSPTAYRIAGALLVLGILAMAGLPLEMLAVLAVIAAVLIGVERLRTARRG